MILIRHGQSEFNVHYGRTRQDPGIRDPGLTDLGREQAAAAARHLREKVRTEDALHRIIASPYRRTLETADILAGVLDLPVTVEPCVGERAAFMCDVGTPRSVLMRTWRGITFEHLAEEWWPAIEESHEALDGRCLAFRKAMTDDGRWQGTIVVTHWGFIRGLTGHTVDNCTMVAFDPTSAHPGGGEVVTLSELC